MGAGEKPGRSGETDEHVIVENRRKINGERDERNGGFRGGGGDGDIEHLGHGIVVDPSLDCVAALEIEILFGGIIGEISSGFGYIGGHTVDVDADMVVVDVAKLEVLNSVELNGEDVVGSVTIVGGIEKTKVLAGEGTREGGGGGDDEGKAMTTELGVLRDDGEGEAGGEREDGGGGGVLEGKRDWIESAAYEPAGFVGETEDSVVFDLSNAVEADVGVGVDVGIAAVGEAGVEELGLLGG